jgi:ribose transport system substrate-binding protein
MSQRSHRLTTALAASALAAAVLAPAALAQDSSEAPAASTAAGGAAGKRVVVLMPTRTNTYINEWARGAEAEAAAQGMTIEIIENQFSQEEQNTQAQQQINAGTPPDAYVWWPADNNAGVATLQALAATGVPVLQTNQLPAEGAAGSWVAYAGVNDKLNGQVAGELLVQARDALVEAGGLTLHSEGGNAIVVKFIDGYQAGFDRMEGFHQAADPAGITVIGEEFAGFSADEAYPVAQALITAHKDEGIDLVYAHNDALAVGVIQALEEAGYTPGTDVAVVGGTCHGDLSELEDGKQFGTGLQAAFLEGAFSVNSVARYLTTGVVDEGEFNAPADADAMPEVPANISTFNFIPNPPVLNTELDSTSLWGYPLRDLCTY